MRLLRLVRVIRPHPFSAVLRVYTDLGIYDFPQSVLFGLDVRPPTLDATQHVITTTTGDSVRQLFSITKESHRTFVPYLVSEMYPSGSRFSSSYLTCILEQLFRTGYVADSSIMYLLTEGEFKQNWKTLFSEPHNRKMLFSPNHMGLSESDFTQVTPDRLDKVLTHLYDGVVRTAVNWQLPIPKKVLLGQPDFKVNLEYANSHKRFAKLVSGVNSVILVNLRGENVKLPLEDLCHLSLHDVSHYLLQNGFARTPSEASGKAFVFMTKRITKAMPDKVLTALKK